MLLPMLFSLLLATWQTIYMVFIAAIIAVIGGLGLGLFLYFSNNNQHQSIKLLNRMLGFCVNVTRSIPYIILLILLYPITQLIVGTTIGTSASIVPLAVAALPFYARLAESAISEVDQGLIEAANAMGATRLQIIFKVLLPEAKVLLIDAATLTTIGLIGYSAMAGVVGGGGLGDLTYFQGYNNGNGFLLYGGVVLLIILVQLCQSYGRLLTQLKKLTSLWALVGFLTFGCMAQIGYNIYQITKDSNVIKVGFMESPAQRTIMEQVKKIAEEKYNLSIALISFGDYNLPNRALNSGNIDANIFQHIPFLEQQVKEFGYHISAIAKTFLYPMGLFSRKIKTLKALPMMAKVAIPNDPTNQGRALMLLEKAGLIQLKPNVSWRANIGDITQNPYGLNIVALQADQIPNNLNNVTLAVINNDFLAKAGLTLKDALFIEPKDSPFANIIAVRDRDRNNPLLQKLIKSYQSPKIKQLAVDLYPNNAAIPLW